MDERTQSKKPEVADVFREYGPAYREEHKLTLQMHKVINAITACRTSVLGGHVDKCDHCGYERNFYNSCRNRYCPKCGALAREKWLLARKRDVLPTVYFHNVFTIPDSLNPLVLRNQRVMYNILFRAGSKTLLELGRDPKHLGGEIGVIAVLHTWGQNLMDHPHLHCIVPGGGLSEDRKKWIYPKKTKNGKDFFVHVNVISDLFKKKFMAYFEEAYKSGKLNFVGKTKYLGSKTEFDKLKKELYSKKWVTYCKETMTSPENVLKYIGKYVNRVAISNNRIVKIENDKVTFRWHDYRDDKIKLMTLEAFEFIRRFLLHILPEGFFKIRYYGILASRNLKTKLKRAKEILGMIIDTAQNHNEMYTWEELLFLLLGIDPRVCPSCGKGRMNPIRVLGSLNRAPP